MRFTLCAERSTLCARLHPSSPYYHLLLPLLQSFCVKSSKSFLSKQVVFRCHFIHDFLVNFFDLSNIIYAFQFLIQFSSVQLSDVEVKIDVVIQGFVEVEIVERLVGIEQGAGREKEAVSCIIHVQIQLNGEFESQEKTGSFSYYRSKAIVTSILFFFLFNCLAAPRGPKMAFGADDECLYNLGYRNRLILRKMGLHPHLPQIM